MSFSAGVAAGVRNPSIHPRIQSPTLPVVPRSKRATTPATVCMSGEFAVSIAMANEMPTALVLAGQLVSGAAWAAAAWLTYSLVTQQDSAERPNECETCHGTGQVPCFCRKWSDASSDASGCGSCGGSLKMTCPHCRGGGTGVPIEARVYIKPEKEYY
jgi:hypothetical protein